jgi:alkylation response protein AidB-like acyl-CoA dehydrogenase
MEEGLAMNISIPHPSGLIPAALADEIIRLSGEAERLGSLHPEQLSLIYAQKWFNLFVPRSGGGLELSLPEGLRLEEGLAWADGSLGWTVTLCGGANWFIGFLQPALAAELFADPRVCLAGSGRASGIAKVTAGGYEISGRWRYATGAPHATAFTANCRIEKDGKPVPDEQGNPLVRAFLLKKEEVILHKDWNAIGMIATASYSFEVRQQQVPDNRCFTIDGSSAILPERIFQYPFLQLAETTLAVNSSGMAARFIGLAEKLGKERVERAASLPGHKEWAPLVEDAKARLQGLRQNFYGLAEASWEDCAGCRPLSSVLLKELSEASRLLASTARGIVDDLYPWCGLTAADPATGINRVWRNLHTASQHSLLVLQA